MAEIPPLAIDVDGTFLMTDLSTESFWSALSQAPGATLKAMLDDCFRPAERRARLAELAALHTEHLPVRREIAALAGEGRTTGREVVLVSSADISLVRRLAADHAITGRVLASTEGLELRGERKAAALMAAFGDTGFDYAGDSAGDWVIWRHAENALIVGRHRRVEARLIRRGKSVSVLPAGWRRRDLWRAMRPEEWWRSLLLVLAPVAAHQNPLQDAQPLVAAMLGFALASAALYLFGDLLDMNEDRRHPLRRGRPIAAGRVPLGVAMAAAAALAILSLVLAARASTGALAMLALFLALGVVYALRLKRLRWIDVATRAALNLVRVLAGAAVAGVALSGNLMLAAFAAFLALACVGRLGELARLPPDSDEPLPGRAWGRRDRGDLLNMAGLGFAGSVLALWLYPLTAEAVRLYPARSAILLAGLAYAGWAWRRLRAADFARPRRAGPAWRSVAVDAGLLLLAAALLIAGSGALARF